MTIAQGDRLLSPHKRKTAMRDLLLQAARDYWRAARGWTGGEDERARALLEAALKYVDAEAVLGRGLLDDERDAETG